MNYLALKNIIETITKTYRCPECNSGISDSNIDIMGTAGNTINIDLECKKCSKHSIMKAEINYISENKINKEFLEKIKNGLQNIKKENIKDEDINNLNKKIKNKNINIKDLFGE